MPVAQGCGCNQRFLNLAENFGHPRAEIIAGEYALTLQSPPDIRLAFLHLLLGIAMQAYVLRHSSLEVLHIQKQRPQHPQPIPWQLLREHRCIMVLQTSSKPFMCHCRLPLAEGLILSELHQWRLHRRPLQHERPAGGLIFLSITDLLIGGADISALSALVTDDRNAIFPIAAGRDTYIPDLMLRR